MVDSPERTIQLSQGRVPFPTRRQGLLCDTRLPRPATPEERLHPGDKFQIADRSRGPASHPGQVSPWHTANVPHPLRIHAADCEFCRIVTGAQTAHVLHETDRTVAFLDENPAVEGHTLVVPKLHEEELLRADDALALAGFRTVRDVANALSRTLEPDGMSVFYTSGDLVGHVTHAHIHLLPRNVDDDIRVGLARNPLDDESAERLVASVTGAFQD